MHNVLAAGQQYFAPNQFHKLPPRVRSKRHSQSKSRRDNPEKLVQWLFGTRRSPKPAVHNSDSDSDREDGNSPSSPDHSAYETRCVRFKEPHPDQAQSKDEDDSIALVTKLSGLSVQEPSYFVLYSQCQDRFPSIARRLPKPMLFSAGASSSSATATVAFQALPTPAHQSWTQRAPAPPPPPPVPNASEGAAFFSDRNGMRSQGCTFCGMLGHRIRGCPAAEEYYRTGCVKIIGNRLHLPTGEP